MPENVSPGCRLLSTARPWPSLQRRLPLLQLLPDQRKLERIINELDKYPAYLRTRIFFSRSMYLSPAFCWISRMAVLKRSWISSLSLDLLY